MRTLLHPAALRLPLLVALAGTGPCGAEAQVSAQLAERIDSIFSPWTMAGSPGAALGVVRGGRLIVARGYGSAQLEFGAPITLATPFHVASEAKQFTATAILLLQERGLLHLDDDVRQHVPELPDFGIPITIRHLLNHSSGLRDQWQILALAGRGGRDIITTAHVLRVVERQRALNFSPGATELYSNTGYTLLAEIVARVSGRPFRDFTRQEIFEPLGMLNTQFLDDPAKPIAGRAYSYGPGPEDGRYGRRILNYAVPGATSLWTTVEDLARWLANFDDPRVGGPAIFERLSTPDTLTDGTAVEWGYGMTQGDHRGFTRFGHGGGDAGFRAYTVRFPEAELGVIVLANLSTVNPGPFGANALALQVADLFLPSRDDSEPALRNAASRPSLMDPALYVGTYEHPVDGVLNVVSEFGTLLLWDLSTGEKTPLQMTSGTDFESPASGIGPGSFELRADGGRRLIVERPGGTWIGNAADPLPPGGLEPYTGRFYSDEIETTWTLAVQDGALHARHLMHDDVRLTPVVRDLFSGDSWFLQELEFVRGAGGEMKGILISAGRIKEVRFRKLDP